jgi:hypothetical protein
LLPFTRWSFSRRPIHLVDERRKIIRSLTEVLQPVIEQFVWWIHSFSADHLNRLKKRISTKTKYDTLTHLLRTRGLDSVSFFTGFREWRLR